MTNPIPHQHTPIMTSAGKMCKVCQAILIDPILDFDDNRIKAVKPKWIERLEYVVGYLNGIQTDAIKDGRPEPLDFVLIHLADSLEVQWPNYIQQLSEKYGEPPHVDIRIK